MRDVAYVHDGSPPQTNAVHVNGASAVLLTIMKAGASSTLDIINGVKSLLPSVSQTLPSSLKLTAVGDQSVFVTDAVSSVVREGVIAAALTGMMILLFLGSWRSTLIITLSIPLAILAALTGLSLLGETINVMTLGGLGARGRHPGRRRHRHHREHQLASRAGQEDRARHSRRRAADRGAGDGVAALHLHRFRADVRARRRRRLPVPAARRGGDAGAGRVLCAVAHAGADAGELSAAQSTRPRLGR